MKIHTTYLILLFTFFVKLNAQESYSPDALKKNLDCSGFVFVNGSTNINDFTFTSDITKQTLISKKNIETEKKNEVDIKILVKEFKTKNTSMYKDFLKLMKADEFPTINIAFTIDSNFFFKKEAAIQIPIEITMAGKKLTYLIPVHKSECYDNKFTLLGYKKLNLTDFGLIPPKKMQGLIKVNNEIFINFGVVFYTQ